MQRKWLRTLAVLTWNVAGCAGGWTPIEDADAGARTEWPPTRDAASDVRTVLDAAPGQPPQPSDAGERAARDASAASAPDATVDASGPTARTYATDRDTFFGAPRCTDELLLCEDFEGEAPGSPADPERWETLGDQLRVDATRAARGQRALHVTTSTGDSLQFIRNVDVAQAASTKLWGRLFLWIDARPSQFSHWTVIEATGKHPAGGTARMRFGGIHIANVVNFLDFNYDIWGPRPSGFHEVSRELSNDTPDRTWHCLEWMIDVSAREARLFRDGVEETGLHAKDSIDGIALDFPAIDGINIGMANYQNLQNSTWSVWIDEVAVDTQRIGCSN